MQEMLSKYFVEPFMYRLCGNFKNFSFTVILRESNLSYLGNVNFCDWTQSFLEAGFSYVDQHVGIGRLTSREIITFSTLISLFNDTFN